MLPRLTPLALLVLLSGACADPPRGDLEVHWSLNGDRSAAACQTAGVASVRILVDHTGAPPDGDPTDPTWPFVDLPCEQGQGTLELAEGIYRVRLVALDAAGDARSGFTDLVGVEVVDGATTRLPENPEVEPPVDLGVAVCGDGVAQAGEWCDATDLGGYDCAKRGFDGGVLGCTATCTLDESACTTCGDGVLAPGEACDASDLGGLDCAGLGWESGTLACAADCTLDETGCVGCGNGRVDAGETCDDGNPVSGDGCSSSCQLEQGDLRVTWTVLAADGTSASTCAAEGIAQVALEVTVAGLGDLVRAETAACADLGLDLPDVAFGLLTVRLSGRDAGQAEVATGSALVDHSQPGGSDVPLDLVALP